MAKYQLMVNGAAGDYYINSWTEEEWEAGIRNTEGFYNEVAVYDSKKELEKGIEDYRGEKRFVVYTSLEGAFYTEEDNFSGNWKGSKYPYATYYGDYNTKEEAKKIVNNFNKRS